LRPLAKPQRAPKQANGKAASASAAPAPRQPAASASPSPASPSPSSAVKAQGSNTPKTPAVKTPQAAPASELDSELKRLQVRTTLACRLARHSCIVQSCHLQAELRAKQEEDEREKAAAVEEMKRLAEKSMMEGYARQAALSDLKAREDRLKHQLALLSKNFASFTSASAPSAPQAAAAVHDAADLPRCIDGIKRLQLKLHSGENEAVLVSQLGLAVNPKARRACLPAVTLSMQRRPPFLTCAAGRRPQAVPRLAPAGSQRAPCIAAAACAHRMPRPPNHGLAQHFDVIVSDGGPSTKGKATVASVKLK
jgi:hypothetical protein